MKFDLSLFNSFMLLVQDAASCNQNKQSDQILQKSLIVKYGFFQRYFTEK